MTPTRDQVIEWANEAAQKHGHTIKATDEIVETLTSFATIAISAGRAQGLREASDLCEAKAFASDLAHANTEEQAFHIKAEAARSCAAAIKQLEGK